MSDQETAPISWHSRKSALMRERILETAVDWLVEQGYAGFSVLALAKQAGISRGALQHHFQTKADLVSAVIDHIVDRRIARFLSDFKASAAITDDQPQQATQLYWENVQTRDYTAYLELMMAARTDAELQQCFAPGALRYDRVWTQEVAGAFPQWGDEKRLQMASDFVAATHLGLLMMNSMPPSRRDDVLQLVEKIVNTLYQQRQ